MADAPPEERIRWTCTEDPLPVDLLWAENSGQRWRWFHETYSVCTLLSAPSEWDYRGRHLRTNAGELMMMEPGEVHVTRRLLGGVSTFRVALFKPELVCRAAEELGTAPPHIASGHLARRDVFAAFTRLHLAVGRGASRLEQDARVADCLTHLVSTCSERPKAERARSEHAAVRRAKEFLRAHCTEAITLDQLAKAARLSRFHFLRAFAREVGLPPHAYVIHVRIERARKLLATGVSITDIATMLGFADHSHFTRHFRRICGVTPSRYIAQRTRA